MVQPRDVAPESGRLSPMTVDGRSKSVALQKAFARRSKAFGRFAVWEAAHPVRHLPADAFSAATWLYDLLPRDSRARTIQTDGVQTLHRLLSRLVRHV